MIEALTLERFMYWQAPERIESVLRGFHATLHVLSSLIFSLIKIPLFEAKGTYFPSNLNCRRSELNIK